MTNLIQDINIAHSARDATPSGCVVIAQLLLKRFSTEEIFAQAERWAFSDAVREAVRFNGAVGVADLAPSIQDARDAVIAAEDAKKLLRQEIISDACRQYRARTPEDLDEKQLRELNRFLVERGYEPVEVPAVKEPA